MELISKSRSFGSTVSATNASMRANAWREFSPGFASVEMATMVPSSSGVKYTGEPVGPSVPSFEPAAQSRDISTRNGAYSSLSGSGAG